MAHIIEKIRVAFGLGVEQGFAILGHEVQDVSWERMEMMELTKSEPLLLEVV